MAARNQGPFGDQDAVTATALGFAGMAMLQSKLSPAISSINLPWMHRLLQGNLVEWWPLLLIAGGVALWVVEVFERRSHKTSAWQPGLGGSHGSRNRK